MRGLRDGARLRTPEGHVLEHSRAFTVFHSELPNSGSVDPLLDLS